MAAGRSAAELECFLAERADHLLRTAVLLAGSREAGEDLNNRLGEPGNPRVHADPHPDRHPDHGGDGEQHDHAGEGGGAEGEGVAELPEAGVNESMVRVSVGTEHWRDLLEDFLNALKS